MDSVNEVRLVGRVSHVDDAERELPSGDRVRGFRLVVPRPARGSASRAKVDTVDVTCWTAGARKALSRVVVDDVVHVEGALRRRFFPTAGGPASRYEVEARTIARRPG